ncbi:hypothetical protein BB558_004527 [Smittium angustum]|uniref:Uncharacterized protein n=1 Tax=Smittium angustum TaxID=133377 RepID=A0A2U1J370_SMIAN|nr:hypothetical protein BB558_004527 [Smittium angustum]
MNIDGTFLITRVFFVNNNDSLHKNSLIEPDHVSTYLACQFCQKKLRRNPKSTLSYITGPKNTPSRTNIHNSAQTPINRGSNFPSYECTNPNCKALKFSSPGLVENKFRTPKKNIKVQEKTCNFHLSFQALVYNPFVLSNPKIIPNGHFKLIRASAFGANLKKHFGCTAAEWVSQTIGHINSQKFKNTFNSNYSGDCPDLNFKKESVLKIAQESIRKHFEGQWFNITFKKSNTRLEHFLPSNYRYNHTFDASIKYVATKLEPALPNYNEKKNTILVSFLRSLAYFKIYSNIPQSNKSDDYYSPTKEKNEYIENHRKSICDTKYGSTDNSSIDFSMHLDALKKLNNYSSYVEIINNKTGSELVQNDIPNYRNQSPVISDIHQEQPIENETKNNKDIDCDEWSDQYMNFFEQTMEFSGTDTNSEIEFGLEEKPTESQIKNILSDEDLQDISLDIYETGPIDIDIEIPSKKADSIEYKNSADEFIFEIPKNPQNKQKSFENTDILSVQSQDSFLGSYVLPKTILDQIDGLTPPPVNNTQKKYDELDSQQVLSILNDLEIDDFSWSQLTQQNFESQEDIQYNIKDHNTEIPKENLIPGQEIKSMSFPFSVEVYKNENLSETESIQKYHEQDDIDEYKRIFLSPELYESTQSDIFEFESDSLTCTDERNLKQFGNYSTDFAIHETPTKQPRLIKETLKSLTIVGSPIIQKDNVSRLGDDGFNPIHDEKTPVKGLRMVTMYRNKVRSGKQKLLYEFCVPKTPSPQEIQKKIRLGLTNRSGKKVEFVPDSIQKEMYTQNNLYNNQDSLAMFAFSKSNTHKASISKKSPSNPKYNNRVRHKKTPKKAKKITDHTPISHYFTKSQKTIILATPDTEMTSDRYKTSSLEVTSESYEHRSSRAFQNSLGELTEIPETPV